MKCTNFVVQRTFRKLTIHSYVMEFVDVMGEEFIIYYRVHVSLDWHVE
jgi:hypothetical protein